MKRLTRSGYIIAGTTAAAVLLGGGVAYAYWTTTGSSSGTAAAGTTSSVTILQTGSIGGLYPDGPAQPIAITITNPNSGSVNLAGVTAAVSGTSDPGCTAADFAISGPVYAGGTIAGGAVVPASAATIRMVNDPLANQDACKGVTVDLAFTAS